MNISNQKRNIMMITLLSGAFLALLAETFLNNALITIMHAFHVNQATAQWLSTGYLLIVGVMIPLSAWVFHRFTTRFSYLTMLLVFIMGTLICVLANNFYVLLAGRMIEAIAAGAMMPFIQNVILQLFKPEQWGVALGLTGLVIAFGPAIGSTISGLILKNYDWRMLFWVLLVTSMLILICALWQFPTINQPHAIKLDWYSFLESISGFGIILFIFSEIGNTGKINFWQIIVFIIGLIILLAFGIRQLKLDSPLINVRVFINSQFNWNTLLSTLSNIAMVGIELVLPMYLQTTRQESALSTGLIMMPGAIIMGIFNPISGYLYDKFGIKRISLIGFSILFVGTLPMVFFNTATPVWLITTSYAIRMIGIALTMMNTFTAGINELPSNAIADGNAAASTIRQIGSSLGTALSMTLMSVGVAVATHQGVAPQLTTEIGFRWAFYLMIAIAIIGIVTSFKLSPTMRKNS